MGSKIGLILVLPMCFLFCTGSFGQEEQLAQELETVGAVGQPAVEPAWSAGVEISQIRYEEPGVMDEEGVMYGAVLGYTYRPDSANTFGQTNNVMFKFEGRASVGEVDYTGSGTLDGVNDYMAELRTLAGADFPQGETTTFTPYFGLGYRYLNDDSSGMISSTGARGYERESNYLYSPLGIEINNALSQDWSWGAVLEYDHFWWGVQKSHLSDAVANFSDISNDQKRGYGFRGSLKVRRMTENINFVFEPFIRYWNIDKSEEENVIYAGAIVGYGYEPENNSLEYGLRMSLEF